MKNFFCSEKLTILFLILLGFALSKTQGNYSFFWVTLIFIVFGLWSLIQLFGSEKQFLPSTWLPKCLDWIVLLFALQLASSPKIIYHTDSSTWLVLLSGLVLLVFLSVVSVYRSNQQWVFLSSLLILCLLRFLTLLVSPTPKIDVFNNTSLAAQALLQGLNPYTQIYPDIYKGLREYKIVPGILYPPFTLYWVTPFKKLFGDIRLAFLITDLGIAFFFKAIAKKLGADKTVQQKTVLVWLTLPVSLFILEQSWIDTLLLFEFSFALYAFLNRRFILCGFLMGVMLATKQYSVIFVCLLGMEVLKQKPRTDVLKTVVSALVTVALLLLPFLIWDFSSLYHSVVEMPLQEPFRMDSFSIWALLRNEFDISLSARAVSFFSLLGLAVGLFNQHKKSTLHLSSSLILTFGFIFFFGKQAFCNYYQLIFYLLLLSLLMGPSHEPRSTK